MRAIVALALILAACSGSGSSPSEEASPSEQVRPTLTGTFTLHDERGWTAGGTCRGGGGYSDILVGMGMTLRDGEGTVLGTSRLSTGTASDDGKACVFEFGFEAVPPADFYAIDAGRRGEQTYSAAELEQQDWTISLGIGR